MTGCHGVRILLKNLFVEEIRDSILPKILKATMNLTDAVLIITFQETVDEAYLFNSSHLSISNETASHGLAGVSLSGGHCLRPLVIYLPRNLRIPTYYSTLPHSACEFRNATRAPRPPSTPR